MSQATKSTLSKDSVGKLSGNLLLVRDAGLVESLDYAIQAFGYLINRGETLSPTHFADRIRESYDCNTCPQNRAVVDALAMLL